MNQRPITEQPIPTSIQLIANPTVIPTTTSPMSVIQYALFNEDYQTGNPKYKVGDKIILGDQCSTRVKGVIMSFSDDSFTIEMTEKESGDSFNPVFVSIDKPKTLVIKTGAYIANEGKSNCMDIQAKGTSFYIDKKLDKNNKSYLNILQSLDAVSTMPLPR